MRLPTIPTANLISATEPRRVWFPALVSVSVVCIAVGVVFWREMTDAVTVWTRSTAYNHCFLIIPLVIALLWHRRELLKTIDPRPTPCYLAIVPVLSMMWGFFALIEINEFEQFTVIAILEVIILSIIGARAFYALLAPLLFLFFLIPFGQFVVPFLQNFTAAFAVRGLQIFNIPVFADGFIIQIPEGSFEVAEACAGLRFLIASIVFGCFFATVMYRSLRRRLIFIGLSVIVPVVANGVRALGLILLGHVEGSATAVETDHVLYGWIFFSLVILVLIAVGMTFTEPYRPIAVDREPERTATKSRFIATTVAGLLLMLVGPAYLGIIIAPASARPAVSLLLAPPDGGWTEEPYAKGSWLPVVDGADQISRVTYGWNDNEVTKFGALYSLPVLGSSFTSSQNGVADPKIWHVGRTARMTVLRSSSAPLAVNATIIEREAIPRLVWWFYVVDDRVTTSVLEAKLLQARTAFVGRDHVGAFIAISTEARDLQTANSVLTRFIDAMAPWRELRPAHFGW